MLNQVLERMERLHLIDGHRWGQALYDIAVSAANVQRYARDRVMPVLLCCAFCKFICRWKFNFATSVASVLFESLLWLASLWNYKPLLCVSFAVQGDHIISAFLRRQNNLMDSSLESTQLHPLQRSHY